MLSQPSCVRHPSIQHACIFVTQVCVLLAVTMESSAFSICVPLTQLASKVSLKCPSCCVICPDISPLPQPDTYWQQPANRGGTRAANLYIKEAEQRSPPGGHGQYCHCRTQVFILQTVLQSWMPVIFRYAHYLLSTVFQSRRLVVTAACWSRKGLLNSLMLMEMVMSSAFWVDLRKDWTYILHPCCRLHICQSLHWPTISSCETLYSEMFRALFLN